MRARIRVYTLLAGLAVAASVALTEGIATAPSAQAQIYPGEFCLRQAGVVGWVWCSSDHSIEWWAYIDDGSYAWADQSNNASNLWDLKAEYLGAGDYANYAAWKTAVLARSAAQGKPIKFQKHIVTEETVQN